jgi:hypothetical protein
MVKKIALILSIIHLGLVICGAAHLHFGRFGHLGHWIDRYAQISGAGASYPFFAPVIGTTIRAQFDLYDWQHRGLGTDDLVSGLSRESELRIYNVIQMIDEDLFNDENRHMLASSWAGKILARHPEADSVKLRVEVFDLPSMAEFRQGIRWDWEPIYRATFIRKGNRHDKKT